MLIFDILYLLKSEMPCTHLILEQAKPLSLQPLRSNQSTLPSYEYPFAGPSDALVSSLWFLLHECECPLDLIVLVVVVPPFLYFGLLAGTSYHLLLL